MVAPNILRPSGPDVTHGNSQGFIYFGNIFGGDSGETINGSIRGFVVETVGVIPGVLSIEIRSGAEGAEQGAWVLGSLLFADGSVRLGLDGKISWSAGFVETTSLSSPAGHNRALIPHTEFNEFGTLLSHAPQLNEVHPFVFFDTPVSQITSAVIGQILTSADAVVIDKGFWEVGNAGATENVVLRVFVGTDNTNPTGPFFENTYIPSQFAADSTAEIDFQDGFGFDEGGQFFLEFSSDAPFSLKTDAGGNIVTSFSLHDLFEVGMITTDLILDNNLDPLLDNDLNMMQVGVPPYSITLALATMTGAELKGIHGNN